MHILWPNNSTPRNAYTYSPKDINWCGHNNTIHNDFNLETTQMPVKGGVKLVVRATQWIPGSNDDTGNLTDTTLSQTARYKSAYSIIPSYRRHSHAKLSYAIGNHDSETSLARVMSRRAHRRGTQGPQYGLFLVLGVGYQGVLSWWQFIQVYMCHLYPPSPYVYSLLVKN